MAANKGIHKKRQGRASTGRLPGNGRNQGGPQGARRPARLKHHRRPRGLPKTPDQGRIIPSAVGLELDVPTPSRPPELAWVAALRLHWLGVRLPRRRKALNLMRRAAGRRTVERSLDDILKGLAELYVNRLHAVQIVLALFQAVGGRSQHQAVQQVARQLRKLMHAFEPEPRKGGRKEATG